MILFNLIYKERFIYKFRLFSIGVDRWILLIINSPGRRIDFLVDVDWIAFRLFVNLSIDELKNADSEGGEEYSSLKKYLFDK